MLTAAVLAVLEAKPNSPVKVLTDGTVALTAFIPTDAAFQQLVREITEARKLPSESAAWCRAPPSIAGRRSGPTARS